MTYFIASMGMWKFPLFIITIAIAILSLKKIADLYFRKELTPAQLVRGLHAIIFWGAVTDAVGFLGQVSGTYNAMDAISRAEAISPAVCAAGDSTPPFA
ncbi:MAG: hypothetical protein JXB45_01205 [Candidatus Krumholzibacteriota bacterium]|nr:hypothetical protein [Candidatus Krumholzibacteriota bacterium]